MLEWSCLQVVPLFVMFTLVGTQYTTTTNAPGGQTMKPLPADTRACHLPEGSPRDDVPLPTLDEQFEMHIESKFLQKGFMVDVVEYYDYNNNKGALTMTKDGQQSRFIYDFKNYQAFLIKDGVCNTTDLNTTTFHFFNFTMTENGGHIGGVSDLFNFGKKYGEVFIGDNETVRGIPVSHWSSCIQWMRYNTIFRMDYYFSRDHFNTPVGNIRIPIRAVLNGTALSPDQDGQVREFRHVYDFLFYRPGPIQDPSVFMVPAGTACQQHSRAPRPQPKLPDRFSMTIEIVKPENKTMSLVTQYFDYIANLSRFDQTPQKGWTTYGDRFGYRPLQIIHDYYTGLEYVIDAEMENCTMGPIPNTSQDATSAPHDPTHVIMKNGTQLFDFSQIGTLMHQGRRLVRNCDCDVWATFKPGYPSHSENSTIEVYFIAENWNVGPRVSQEPVLMGISVTTTKMTKDGLMSAHYINNIYGYTDQKPVLKAFDIRPCYSRISHMKHFMFKLVGPKTTESMYDSLVFEKHHILQPQLRKTLSTIMHVPQIRITDFMFDQTSSDSVDVWVTLLDKPSRIGDVPRTPDSWTKEKAYAALQQALGTHQGVLFTVPYPDGKKTVQIKPGSLMTDSEALDPRKPVPLQTPGYTPGSMAAVAIIMLLIGAILGVGGAFLLWKRGTGIPYQVQN